MLAYKARECSACGAQIIAFTEVQEIEGELVVFGSRKSGAKGSRRSTEEAFYAEINGYSEKKGYASGWCWHQFQARFKGERPPKWFETAGSARALDHDQKLAQASRNRVRARQRDGRVMAKSIAVAVSIPEHLFSSPAYRALGPLLSGAC